jgi:hypothetical protein
LRYLIQQPLGLNLSAAKPQVLRSLQHLLTATTEL